MRGMNKAEQGQFKKIREQMIGLDDCIQAYYTLDSEAERFWGCAGDIGPAMQERATETYDRAISAARRLLRLHDAWVTGASDGDDGELITYDRG